jgi:dTDP-4-dehydrorhamnose 3,5-epimerase
MEVRHFGLGGLLEIRPTKIEDERGYFSEVYRDDVLQQHGCNARFVQDNQSLSIRPGTIRGIHFQSHPAAQGKLVRCLSGRIFDVAVDLRNGSPTFGQWQSVTLTPEENNHLWVPAGFGHGFCTLEPNSIIAYRVTSYYSPENDKGLAWDDPQLAIEWPDVADSGTLSPKDRQLPKLRELPAFFSVDE